MRFSAILAYQEKYAACAKMKEFVLSDTSQKKWSNRTLMEEVQGRYGEM